MVRSSKPDLVVQSVTFTPASPSTTKSIDADIVVKNQGASKAGASKLRANWAGLDTILNISLLQPNATKTVRVSRGAQPEGVSTLTATADYNSKISESNESNNVKAATVTVVQPTGGINAYSTPPGAAAMLDGILRGTTPTTITGVAAGNHNLTIMLTGYIDFYAPVYVTEDQTTAINAALQAAPKPDLIISSLTFNQGLQTGSTRQVTINARVTNIGNASSAASVLGISGASNTWPIQTQSLQPGQGQTLTASANLSSGTFAFTATADVNNEVQETSEDNNQATASVTVAISLESFNTFGKTSIGQTRAPYGSNQWGGRYYLNETALVTNLTAYLEWDGSGSNSVKAAIYNESFGSPAFLVGQSIERTFSTVPSWVMFSFGQPVTLKPGYYWIGPLGQEAGVYGYVELSNQTSSFTKDNAPWPNPISPMTGYFSGTHLPSVYVTYIPAIGNQTGALYVTSTPSSASINLDANPSGTTPATISNLQPGNHNLVISSPGYRDYAQIVFISPGQTTQVNATLSPISAPNTSTTYTVPVLVMRYFPLKDASNLNESITGYSSSLTSIRAKVDRINTQLMTALEKGSTYQGYKDGSAQPALDYAILDDKEFLYAIPKSTTYAPFADHIKILNNISICNYVENLGVKEVWVYMYHTSDIVPIESNMAGPYGDISNSYRQPDLPVCAKTYTVYDYNYGRDLGEALEDHGHQVEALMGYADRNLFWNVFVSPHGQSQPTVNRCGNVHIPPNAINDYDWYNQTVQSSDCEDWRPEGTGTAKLMNCNTWSSASSCFNSDPFLDANVGWKVYWFQNMPGRNNRLSYQGCELRNWWDFTGDFDAANAVGRTLKAC